MSETGSTYRKKMELFTQQVTIYPVSCEPLADGRSDLQWLDAVLAGGSKIVQLRDKISDDRTILEKAKMFRRRTRAAGALFIVNNRIDIAMLAKADGVHLGNTDIPVEEARRIVPSMIIGVSANTEEQAATVEKRGASYYNIGPIFATQTKKNIKTFIGSEAIAAYSVHSNLPFTVMGGIKLNHVPELVKLKARRIAVVTALSKAPDIEKETRKWIKAINENC